MATNYIQPGKLITIAAPAALTSGQALQVGKLACVASTDAASGAQVVVSVEGVHIVPKKTGTAWTQFQQLYWDNTAKEFTHTDATGDNDPAGKAAAPAASADASGLVLINA